MCDKNEFGDFQTPEDLATRSVALVADLFGTPDLVIEPTAGLGEFLKACATRWGHKAEYQGYEINAEYVAAARKRLSEFAVQIFQRDFFSEDWKCNLARPGKGRVPATPEERTHEGGKRSVSRIKTESIAVDYAQSAVAHSQIEVRPMQSTATAGGQ